MKNRSLFALFAVLIALRDILSELWLTENPVVFALTISAVTSLVSLTLLMFRGGLFSFLKKLPKPGVATRAIPLGILSAFIYGLGYFLIKHVGAGLFNVIDYGMTPIATILIGKLFFSEKIQKGFWYSLLLYLLGVGLLNFNRGMAGAAYLLLILIIPVAVSISDALSKWLLSPEKGRLNKEELLIVRFLPGTFALLALLLISRTQLVVVAPIPLLFVSLLCGWLPVWLLCAALKTGELSELANWELLIPGLAFFGTLAFHIDDNFHFLPIIGAMMILISQQVMRLKK